MPFTFGLLISKEGLMEEEMETHASALGWMIPGTGQPDGIQSMGRLKVGHD